MVNQKIEWCITIFFTGDMVATEALYHKDCLTRLWNSYRKSITPNTNRERKEEIESECNANNGRLIYPSKQGFRNRLHYTSIVCI